ncbi:VOC family protein [Halobacterium sp. R2-5]|uniref:VOC family protein n=1 Tax=Halobacterium sp. R2-5 TaxID=2715751 RepID=UPI00142492DB|nr:VOC family protein [Halobacterium sp. R2-5]NIB98950.1 ring-cleaving dioxygenase [Halobacterium sp. R2-5]
MLTDTPGIHHVTGIVESAQRNADFYVGVLGLRLVKRTVNQEDMLRYHLFYGNETGEPGTVMTCFPFADEVAGRVGKPQIAAVAFVVPPGSLPYWRGRLAEHGVDVTGTDRRFGDSVLRFTDPDGTNVELVEGEAPVEPWTGGPVPEEYAIRCVHSVTALPTNPYTTGALLDTLGFALVGEEAGRGETRIRYEAGGEYATVVDLLDRPTTEFGREGTGSIQHVAVRADGVDELYEWHEVFRERDLNVSRVRDRYFFQSLYVREPGGILVELATEEPGLAADEAVGELGETLVLPDQFVEDRDLIESQLPPLSVPYTDD